MRSTIKGQQQKIKELEEINAALDAKNNQYWEALSGLQDKWDEVKTQWRDSRQEVEELEKQLKASRKRVEELEK